MTERLLPRNHGLSLPKTSDYALRMNSDENGTIGNSPSLLNQSEGYNLMRLEREAKNEVNMNKLKMIAVLKFILLIIVIATLFDERWYIMAETPDYQYWVNFLFIRKICQKGVSGHYCDDSGTVYSTYLASFYNNDCALGKYTSDDPPHLCSIISTYYYGGIVTFVIIILGLFTHLIHIIQLGQIWAGGSINHVKCINPKKVSYSTIFFYISSIVYWFFASTSFLNTNTATDFSLYERFGRSLIWYTIAIVVYILVTIWSQRVLSTGSHRDMVNDLLNAEIRFVEGLDGQNGETL